MLAKFEIEATITLALENLFLSGIIAERKSPGDAVLVTLTRILASADLPFTLRIVPFGSEELGLHGGRFYVQSLSDEALENTKEMLNFAALSSGTGVSVFGDKNLTEFASTAGAEAGVDVGSTRGMSVGTSDFANFRNTGVPFMMSFGSDALHTHTERDTLEFV